MIGYRYIHTWDKDVVVQERGGTTETRGRIRNRKTKGRQTAKDEPHTARARPLLLSLTSIAQTESVKQRCAPTASERYYMVRVCLLFGACYVVRVLPVLPAVASRADSTSLHATCCFMPTLCKSFLLWNHVAHFVFQIACITLVATSSCRGTEAFGCSGLEGSFTRGDQSPLVAPTAVPSQPRMALSSAALFFTFPRS